MNKESWTSKKKSINKIWMKMKYPTAKKLLIFKLKHKIT